MHENKKAPVKLTPQQVKAILRQIAIMIHGPCPRARQLPNSNFSRWHKKNNS